MNHNAVRIIPAIGLVATGIALGALGIWLGETDDAPGAALIGILLMAGLVFAGVRQVLRKS